MNNQNVIKNFPNPLLNMLMLVPAFLLGGCVQPTIGYNHASLPSNEQLSMIATEYTFEHDSLCLPAMALPSDANSLYNKEAVAAKLVGFVQLRPSYRSDHNDNATPSEQTLYDIALKSEWPKFSKEDLLARLRVVRHGYIVQAPNSSLLTGSYIICYGAPRMTVHNAKEVKSGNSIFAFGQRNMIVAEATVKNEIEPWASNKFFALLGEKPPQKIETEHIKFVEDKTGDWSYAGLNTDDTQ